MAIFETYTVKAGDSLSRIASAHGTDADSIARMSGLADKNKLKVGQVLNVRQISETYHVVAKGDTLSGIAARFKVDIATLQQANGIANASKIALGAKLIIPTAKQGPTASSVSPARGLGSLSRKYEVGSNGAATVSKGVGDHGGVSYGSYQLSSKFGRPAEFLAADGKPWAADFAGLEQGTEPFSKAWKAVAARDLARFEAAQHEFIKRTHYDVQVKKIVRDAALDVSARSRALQDVAWSTAVQHGPNSKLIAEVVKALPVKPSAANFDRELIIAIYGERGRRNAEGNLAYFSKSSQEFQAGVASRFRNELKDALDMLAAEGALSAVAPFTAPPAATTTTIAAPTDGAQSIAKRAAGKLSDDDLRLMIEKYGNHEANSDFLAGRIVLIAIRKNSNTKQFRKGTYDDLMLVVRRQPTGAIKLTRFALNTEPAGEYAFDGNNKKAGSMGTDTDRDGKKELGRLVAGTYHYMRQAKNFMNAPYFKARDVQVTERDTNQDGNFTPLAGDNIDPVGADRTMYIHRGGAEGVGTWSAGCQTIPKGKYPAFLAAVAGQDRFSYVLINAA